MLAAFTLLHVVISLIGIGAGLVVVGGMLTGRRLDGWTATFLASTVATSVTGFLFPFTQFLPSHAVGIFSLIVLPIAIYARYSRQLARSWRWIYVVGSVLSLYLNVFVLVVQLFLKVPALHALAPTQTEPPFQIAQLVVLAVFVILGVASAMRFRTASLMMPDRPILRAGQSLPS
jgi:magnesium-transporting ATPase (P-type)